MRNCVPFRPSTDAGRGLLSANAGGDYFDELSVREGATGRRLCAGSMGVSSATGAGRVVSAQPTVDEVAVAPLPVFSPDCFPEPSSAADTVEIADTTMNTATMNADICALKLITLPSSE